MHLARIAAGGFGAQICGDCSKYGKLVNDIGVKVE